MASDPMRFFRLKFETTDDDQIRNLILWRAEEYRICAVLCYLDP